MPAILGLTALELISPSIEFQFLLFLENVGEGGMPCACSSMDFHWMPLFCWQAAPVPCMVPGASAHCIFPPCVGCDVPTLVAILPYGLRRYDFLYLPTLSAFHLLNDSFIYAFLPLVSCIFIASYSSNGHFIEFPNGRRYESMWSRRILK